MAKKTVKKPIKKLGDKIDFDGVYEVSLRTEWDYVNNTDVVVIEMRVPGYQTCSNIRISANREDSSSQWTILDAVKRGRHLIDDNGAR